MKRYTGQQALYEAINRSRAKAKRGSILEKLRSQMPVQDAPEPPPREDPEPPAGSSPPAKSKPTAVKKPSLSARSQRKAAPAPPVAESVPPTDKVNRPGMGRVQTWLRPKPVQLNAGRIEISVPYHIGVSIALAVVLTILVAYKLGQRHAAVPESPAVTANPPARSLPRNAASVAAGGSRSETPAPTPRAPESPPPRAQGDHWIVLGTCEREADFRPVKDHFAEHGIELGWVALDRARQFFADNGLNVANLPAGNGYMIVTANMYDNPEKPGTDGYAMKQKVVEVGALYKGKAPAGCKSFAPQYFGDAYGMKIQEK